MTTPARHTQRSVARDRRGRRIASAAARRPARPTALAAALLVTLAVACTDPQAVFEDEALPVLARSCAATTCHGVAPSAEAAGEVLDWRQLLFRLDSHGAIADPEAARTAALRAANTREDPRFSSLLRKALPAHAGGLPHAGGAIFASSDDPAAQALVRWLRSEAADAGGEGKLALPPLVQHFRDDVEPRLMGAGCTFGNCHGTQSPVPLRLDSGTPWGIPVAATLHNYASAKAMLALGGDGTQSRLLRKTLRLRDGGLPHRAGSMATFEDLDSPTAHAIATWACREREAVAGAACDPAGPTPLARVAVTVAVPQAEGLFDLAPFAAGTTVRLAERQGATWSWTSDVGASICQSCDVRDPVASDDGQSVVVSAQASAGGDRLLWQLPVSGGGATPWTEAVPGRVVHDRDPAIGPGGRVFFVSDRAGMLADDGGVGSEVFEALGPGKAPRRRTFSPHRARFVGAFAVGEETSGTVAMTLLRGVFGEGRRAHPFRFQPDLRNEVHQHFGMTLPFEALIATRELADGNYVAVGLALDATDTAGTLVLSDRNLGPALPEDTAAAPSLPAWLPPWRRVSLPAAAGLTAVADPAPLPDGSVLLVGRSAAGTPLLRMRWDRHGEGAIEVAPPEVLLAAPAERMLRQPAPLLRRAPLPAVKTEHGDRDAATGTLVHQGVPMIEALLARLPPTGQRIIRSDLATLRLLEPLPLAPGWRTPLAPTQRPADALPSASRASLAPLAPARVLAELGLAPDGSVYAEVPAGSAFRLQALDGEGLAVGAAHNRWLHAEGGQAIPQGVHARSNGPYRAMCATCHGANDGNPQGALPIQPDLMTSASWSMARYLDCNPRRPLPPQPTGAATRIEVDWRRDIVPIVQARCAGCHGAAAAAGLDLRPTPTALFDQAYEALLRRGDGSGHGWRYVDATMGRARTSFLAEKLLGRELEAPRSLLPGVGPHGGVSDGERAAILRWIELGASYIGTPMTEGP